VQHDAADHGITVKGASVDDARMMSRKDGIVGKMTKGIEFLFRKNKITWLKGHGRLTGTREGRWAELYLQRTVMARGCRVANIRLRIRIRIRI
jgi:pyruvate/2-oxoglutarate dehydrogenase complex dihydrolipoamide dehydrogenase (E3) component